MICFTTRNQLYLYQNLSHVLIKVSYSSRITFEWTATHSNAQLLGKDYFLNIPKLKKNHVLLNVNLVSEENKIISENKTKPNLVDLLKHTRLTKKFNKFRLK